MYLIILKGNTNEVDMIYKNPPEKLLDKGHIVESLEEEGLFTRIDGILYYIKEND